MDIHVKSTLPTIMVAFTKLQAFEPVSILDLLWQMVDTILNGQISNLQGVFIYIYNLLLNLESMIEEAVVHKAMTSIENTISTASSFLESPIVLVRDNSMGSEIHKNRDTIIKEADAIINKI